MVMGFATNVLNLQLKGFNENIFKAHKKILSDRNYIHYNEHMKQKFRLLK